MVEKVISHTYTATIYCGFKERQVGGSYYPNTLKCLEIEARNICKEYCDEVGLCVTFKLVEFLYINGDESGVEVGLINYPRFKSTPTEIQDHT